MMIRNSHKILFIVLDGLGDEPIPDFGGKTPLQAAKTPNLDCLAAQGVCGLARVSFQGATPTSEEGHFSLFGYNPVRYGIKRGIITATGAGIKARPKDVALRGNLATVDEELNIIDRRGGRIKNPQPFIRALKGIKIDGIKFLIKSATEHRLGIVMRGPGLSPNVSAGDLYYSKLERKAGKIEPLDKTKEAVFTAQVLTKFLEKTQKILQKHPENANREKQGLPRINYILLRGASSLLRLPSFKEKYGLKPACIAGKFLYQQIARMVGMKVIKVRGATGKADTNLKAKFKRAKRALRRYDFVFLHIKATDSLAEDGKYREKRDFIEKVDKEMKALLRLKKTLVVVTCDHSTCSLKKRHCSLPCPVLIWGSGKDEVQGFSEKNCYKGKLGLFDQVKTMEKVMACLRSACD